ncbi:MAG: hypothetical protein KGQ87_07235 [Verrucomicrobia bacterium]|nr:hypothetical protein [Verrucomicrobiota bacterium]
MGWAVQAEIPHSATLEVSPESSKLLGDWLDSCASMRALKTKPSNHHDHGKLKEALMQGEEREAAKLFQEVRRQSGHAGLFAAMAEEVEAQRGH